MRCNLSAPYLICLGLINSYNECDTYSPYCGGVPWSPTKSHDLGEVELGWVSWSGQLLFPCRGTLMYIAGPEDIVEASSKQRSDGGSVRNRQTDVRSCPRQVWAVLRTVLQTWTELYRHPHGICRLFIRLYGHRVQLFLVLATYCVVLGPIPSTEHLIEHTLTLLSPWRSCTATAHPP